MASSVSDLAVWEEIERSESYLVCSMFEEAVTLSSSTLRRLRDNKSTETQGLDLIEMLEAAGMVLVQSLKELGRTSEIFDELKALFGSIPAIPAEVIITGSCFQISEGSLIVREFLEEFLSKWRYVDGQYVLADAEPNVAYSEGHGGSVVLEVDDYLKVVELYVGKVLNDMDLAISWVEKAAIPPEKQQALLRRLHSLYSLKDPNRSSTSQGSSSTFLADRHEACSCEKDLSISKGAPTIRMNTQGLPNRENDTGQAVLKSRGRTKPQLLWFCITTFNKTIFNRKIFLGCLIFLISYVLRRKRATLKRILIRQSLAVKKALVDLWQLAFSYQLNPLASIQPVPTATH